MVKFHLGCTKFEVPGSIQMDMDVWLIAGCTVRTESTNLGIICEE